MSEINVSDNLVLELKRLNLKQKEISDFLGMSLRGVQRWCKEVAIPSDKLGKLVELGIDPYFVTTGRRQEIDVDILRETLRVMLPVLQIMNDDIDIKTKTLGDAYNTLLEQAVKNTKKRIEKPKKASPTKSISQTIEGNQNIQSSDSKVNQSIKGDGNKQTFKAK